MMIYVAIGLRGVCVGVESLCALFKFTNLYLFADKNKGKSKFLLMFNKTFSKLCYGA